MKPLQGINTCTYCGATNPDSEAVCPVTGTRHHLISESDKSSQIETGKDTPYDVMHPQGPDSENAKRDTAHHGQRHEAHGFEPGDDTVVRHCPFCGSGNVWGKSDGNVHCEFCGKDYTIQVQPEYPQAAQNLNGVPLGLNGVEDGFDEDGNPLAQSGPEDGDDGAGGGGMLPDPGNEDEESEEPEDEGSPEDEEDQGKGGDDPPWLKKSSLSDDRISDAYERHIHWSRENGHDPDTVKALRAHEVSGGITRAEANGIADLQGIGGGDLNWRSQKHYDASLATTGVRKGWPIGGRLDRHFTAPVEEGGHGWDEEKLGRLPSTWRQERHDRAHGLGAVVADMDEYPDSPGHEHWSEEDSTAGYPSMQRYRQKEARFFFTAAGDVLSGDDLINHLAIRHADDRQAVISQVREFNRQRRE